jgi:DNA polymerase III alpha subunit
MKTQLHIRTEYSFKWAYGPVPQVTDYLKATGAQSAAITDRNSTFGHFQWNKHCKRNGIKPIFGVELGFIEDIQQRQRRQNLFWFSFLAKNNAGLKEIYALVEEATSPRNFYMVPRLPMQLVQSISQDVVVLRPFSRLPDASCAGLTGWSAAGWLPQSPNSDPNTYIAVSDNYMITAQDRSAYQILTGRLAHNRPSPMHILDETLLRMEFDLQDEHFALSDRIASECDATIPTATNIRYSNNQTLEQLCLAGASARSIELNDVYAQRLQHELSIIQEKEYEHYFFVIADLVSYAKEHMLVGPGRGSSCGSLVCYLLGITDIDPIPHGLIFERFIDITRYDLPDIDIDFQDSKRELVFDYLDHKYGSENVARLGTILKYKPKSAINDAAKALKIPDWETDILKAVVVKRTAGDSYRYCIRDTYKDVEAGQKFIAKYPAMQIACDLEGHAHHTGKHAAGVVITNEPINNFVAKDSRTNTIQIDKYDAEQINLMKIDALGLKTLSIIADCLENIGWTHEKLLQHPLNDDAAFAILRNEQFCGIFQFEGYALQKLCKLIKVEKFTDIVALTALARPGPLDSGAAIEWTLRRTGRQRVGYLHPLMEKFANETYGMIVFQEQVMRAAREIGQMSWKDTLTLRKAMGKSMGPDVFEHYWNTFKQGATSQGVSEEVTKQIWDNINKFGGYAFNKSHAVAYGMVSYWCCVLKAHAPEAFALATFRNTLSSGPIKKYLRELKRIGYDFKPYDLELSETSWSFKNGMFLGGLTNIKGIADKKAQKLLLARDAGMEMSLPKTIVTPYDNIFEGRQKFGDVFDNPKQHNIMTKPVELADITIQREGYVCFVAKIVERYERSLNEGEYLAKRKNIKVPNDRWLNMRLEDDTGEVFATISRFKYPSLGVTIMKEYTEGDWFIFGGNATEGRVFIEKFKYLGRGTTD